MRQSYRLVALIAVALSLTTAQPFVFGQAQGRAIEYDPNIPIVERLLPGDTSVVVTKTGLSSTIGIRSAPFEREVQRLSLFDRIALLEISDAQGHLYDGGTWVRTRLLGQVIEAVKGNGSMVEFSHDGGRTAIGPVTVTAGVYPQFTVGQRYLVFFVDDHANKRLNPSLAFHVDSENKLEPLQLTDGALVAADSKLIGRTTVEVVAALRQVK